MKTVKDILWTWLLPEQEHRLDREEWTRHGGKWIVFGQKDRIVRLTEGLAPFIDRGEVQSAKYWNGDPSAVNV